MLCLDESRDDSGNKWVLRVCGEDAARTALWLEIEQCLAALHIERCREMLVHNEPLAIVLAQANRRAHPGRFLIAAFFGNTASVEIVAERHVAALDKLVEAGVLPSERRPGAEFLAWSAVHGFSMLLIDGPLRALSTAQRQAIGQRLLDMVEQGL